MSTDFYNISIVPYQGIIIKICRAYTYSKEDFEDYYQEVCLQLWKSKDNFNEKSAWSTWVYRLTLNVCLTLQKKKKISAVPFIADKSNLSTYQDPITESSNAIDKLYAAIKQLKAIDRAIILLYLEEKSYEEISVIMGTNTSNIGVRINRIKKRLKKLLNGKVY